MKPNLDDGQEQRLARWLASADGETVPPDEALLQRLRTESTEVFLTANAADAGPARSGRSWIMNTQNWKWLIPAAGVAVLLALVGVWPNSRSEGKVYGLADVPAMLRAAQMLHISGRLFLPPYSMPGVKQSEVPYEMWLDSPGGRLRQTSVSYSVDNDGFKISRGESVSDGEYLMNVDHTKRTVSYGKLNEFRRLLQTRLNLEEVQQRLLGGLEGAAGFTKSGHESIAGKEYDIWEGTIEEPQVAMSMRTKWWLAPQTGRIGRMQMWVKGPVGEEWIPAVDVDTVERDAPPPAGAFDTTPPAGYTVLIAKEAAQVPPLAVESGGDVDSLSCTKHIAFQFADGSLLLGWSSRDKDSAGSQAELFAGLERGGRLPKLPLEIAELRRVVQGREIKCHGRHLAYTRTGDDYHEWSLYVADRTLGLETLSNYYRVVQRYNVATGKVQGVLNMSVSQPLLINDATGFNAFVRGAMAELSDNGSVPEGVTYENTLRLIEQIRASLTADPPAGENKQEGE